PAGHDPWGGATLEWFALSPPPPHNFDVVPDVRSSEPLRDIREAIADRGEIWPRHAEIAHAAVPVGVGAEAGTGAEPPGPPATAAATAPLDPADASPDAEPDAPATSPPPSDGAREADVPELPGSEPSPEPTEETSTEPSDGDAEGGPSVS